MPQAEIPRDLIIYQHVMISVRRKVSTRKISRKKDFLALWRLAKLSTCATSPLLQLSFLKLPPVGIWAFDRVNCTGFVTGAPGLGLDTEQTDFSFL